MIQPLRAVLPAALAFPFFALVAAAQPFTLSQSLPGTGTYRSAITWGDFGLDADLDLVVSGNWAESIPANFVIRTAQSFHFGHAMTEVIHLSNTSTKVPLPAVQFASIELADFDGDADLDLLMTGRTRTGRSISRVFATTLDNEMDGVYEGVSVTPRLPGVERGDARWGDFDNDGDPDILVTGAGEAGFVAQLFRNDGRRIRGLDWTFTEIQTGFPAVAESAVQWVDLDNDGDLDLVLTGLSSSPAGFITRVYRNDGIGAEVDSWRFTEVPHDLPRLAYGSIDAGDFDSDGDADLLLTGCTDDDCSRSLTVVLRNDTPPGGNILLVPVAAGLPGVFRGTAMWGDYDADGDLDILLTGENSSDPGSGITRIYRNDAGVFVDADAGLPGVTGGSAIWGDYDRDGDLDVVVTGYRYDNREFVTAIYRNGRAAPNRPPAAPTGLQVQVTESGEATLTWNAVNDAETPQAALTYNVRVGTVSAAAAAIVPHVLSPLAYVGTFLHGQRMVARSGNTGHGTETTVRRLIPGQTYFASVQAIDSGFSGSDFSQEVSFTMPGWNDNFLAEIRVSDTSPNSRAIYFGTHANALDGFDSEHDITIPVAAPNAFDAHFWLGGHQLIKDVRHTNQSTLTWELRARAVSTSRNDLRYEWSPAELPAEGSFHIRNTVGSGQEVDMRTATAFETTERNARLEIVYRLEPARTPTHLEATEHPGAFALRGAYPNPASGRAHVTFDLDVAAEVRIDVYDLLGRLVFATPWRIEGPGVGNSVTVDAGSFASGIYLYRVRARSEGAERSAAGRLVVAAGR